VTRQRLANSKWSSLGRCAPTARLFATGALIASLLALSGCPGSLGFAYGGDPDAGISLSCDNVMTVLSTCVGCHSNPPVATFASLDLSSANPGQRLVGVAASGDGACLDKGSLLNRTTVPATGILIDKINDHQTCGASMPFGTPILGATDIACLQSWANGLVANAAP
jgi:hypothetical protein